MEPKSIKLLTSTSYKSKPMENKKSLVHEIFFVNDLYSVSTNCGFSNYEKQDNYLKFIENINLPINQGINIVLPNLRTNLYAIVPQNEQNKVWDNQILIWDNSSQKIYYELKVDKKILNLFFTYKKWLLVHSENQVIGFDLEKQFKKQIILEENFKNSVLSIKDLTFTFAFNHPEKLYVQFLTYSEETNYFSEKILKPFKNTPVDQIAFTEDGENFLCADYIGSKIKIYQNSTFENIGIYNLQSQYFTKYFSQKVLKIYMIKTFIFLIYYSDHSFKFVDCSKIVSYNWFFKNFIIHDFNPKKTLWIYEQNNHNFPIIFYKIKYYDQATDTVDQIFINIHHLDGNVYELLYNARLDQSLSVQDNQTQWFSSQNSNYEQEGFCKI